MKIRQILESKRTLSFEFFPPADDAGVKRLFNTIYALKAYDPDFVSITYGAGGSTQAVTVEMAVRAQREIGLTVMAHITCAAQTAEFVDSALSRLATEGIENLIALRGDPPKGKSKFTAVEGGYTHASDLISHVKRKFQFGVAAAGYPEGHPESIDLESDMKFTRLKIDLGAEFLITQLFYDNDDYYAFVDRAQKAGVNVPIIPGLMPVLSASQIRRITGMCGASIPKELDELLDRHGDDNRAVRQIGIEHTTRQASDLLDSGVPGVHFYVLNRRFSMTRILENLRESGHTTAFS
ncbi:MAG: methylenetetrahydrofolate reductase [NAD(P)H] [Chloroflexi bacterium]|jgi:methylenetetrahydrofolate reductase (NADPH)|nr:methylenetetrahydrofolate reductase [NAD(P)H] [Chloroflexota bacterium]MDP6422705.1 methylenetetrahydrofolate reductase [NAD(P)H] [SAR202 cluster bacterium]|tara:strand:+ start:9804 stop:10688 length:885 start_codon:yes stop_codon:yes gene_type:complete